MDTERRSEGLSKLQVKIGGMQCSFCVESIRQALLRMEGVSDVSVSLAHEEVLVQYDPNLSSPQQLKDTLADMGYTWRDPDKIRSFEEEEAELRTARNKLLTAAAATVVALTLMIAMWLGFRQPWFRWPMLALALATMFWPAWHVKRMAWASLRRGILNQHVLLEFAAFAGLTGGFIGFFNSEFPIPDFFGVAILVTAYHLLSGYISLLVRTRSSQAIKRLMDLQPATARVIRDGNEQEIPVSEVNTGDLVRIRPGESIPVDGLVVEGVSYVDQSLVTGEPVPVEKGRGDEVIGGSINVTGRIAVRVTHVGVESFLQKVAQHIQEARALKPGIIVLVDRVLKYFVPGVLVAAALAFIIWTLGSFLVIGEVRLSRAVFAALAVLVMGYPCALGMAAPLAMIRGSGIAAQRGIMMRSGEAFQAFKDVRKILLDKTGTVTRGKPSVTNLVPLKEGGGDILKLAASVEASSEHPLGRAIVDYALDKNVELSEVEDFRAYAGKGIAAKVEGQRVLVGTARFLQEQGIDTAELEGKQLEFEEQGKTVALVSSGSKPLGIIAISDTLKDGSREAVARMKAAGMETILITGDNWHAAWAVGAQAGIDQVMAEVLPNDKANEVRKIQRQGYRVAMVGDGINDAPALMQADVGIAISGGTDIAIESADIILVGDNLGGVVDAYRIARSGYTKTIQNISLAFAFNGIGVPAAMTGLVHPVWAMIAMAASVTVILLNSFADRLITLPQFPGTKETTHTLTLEVPSIHCEGCGVTIQAALKKLRRVETVEVDVPEKIVTVAYRGGQGTEKEIREGIVRAGHTVAGREVTSHAPESRAR